MLFKTSRIYLVDELSDNWPLTVQRAQFCQVSLPRDACELLPETLAWTQLSHVSNHVTGDHLWMMNSKWRWNSYIRMKNVEMMTYLVPWGFLKWLWFGPQVEPIGGGWFQLIRHSHASLGLLIWKDTMHESSSYSAFIFLDFCALMADTCHVATCRTCTYCGSKQGNRVKGFSRASIWGWSVWLVRFG